MDTKGEKKRIYCRMVKQALGWDGEETFGTSV